MQSKLTPAPDVTSAGDSSVAQAAVGQSPLDVAGPRAESARRRILAAAFGLLLLAVAMPLAAILRFDMDPPAAEFRWSIQLGLVMGIYQLVAGWLPAALSRSVCRRVLSRKSEVSWPPVCWSAAPLRSRPSSGRRRSPILPIIATGLALFAMLTARFASGRIVSVAAPPGGRPTIVVGAGDVGQSLALSDPADPKSGYKPVALLDDNPTKQRLVIQGVPVRGTSPIWQRSPKPQEPRWFCSA